MINFHNLVESNILLTKILIMKRKLPLLMLAAMPLLAFGQNAANSKLSKKQVLPISKKAIHANASIKATANAPAAYCVPVDLSCSDGDLITNVTVAGINNTSDCSPAGYGDYTAMQGQIVAGQSYPISVTVGSGWFERVSAWIDFDNSQSFEAGEFLGEIGSGSNNVVSTLTGNIAIPSTLASGSYRLRVMVSATGSSNPAVSDACADGNYGEVEDYTLVIAPTGCLTATEGQYPSATFTPTCNGSAANITTAGWLNEYSKVNVIAGTQYTFSTSNASYFITIGNEAGTAILASGTGSVNYTPAANGVVRFYSHLSSNCDGSNGTHSRTVKCGTPPPPPTEPEYGCNDQTYEGTWLLANNIVKISETSNFLIANDFFVPMGTDSYSPSSVSITVVPIGGQADIGNLTVKILSDNAGAPGAVIQTFEGLVPVITPLTPTFANYATFDLSVALSGLSLPGSGTEAKRYWVAAQVTSKSATPQGIFWIGHQYYDGWQTKPNYQSVDGGATYAVVTNANTPGNFDSNWVIDAECVLAVGEAGNKAVSFYPNPVKDVLNINSKGNIETVHVYNIAGQKMAVPSKLVNGKLDMSKLAPGTYIVSTILQDGKNESFKVIKK